MHKKRTYISVGLLLAVGCLFPSAYAQAATTVTSDITTNKTWDTNGSPYIISSPISVAQGAKLTINPGVVVQFAPGTQLDVFGSLVSSSRYDDRTSYFTSVNDSISSRSWDWDDWFKKRSTTPSTAVAGEYNGIFAHEGSVVSIKDSEIRYAASGITSTGAAVSLSDVTLKNNVVPLTVDFATSLSQDDVTYTSNTDNSINVSGDYIPNTYTFKQSDIPYTLLSSPFIPSTGKVIIEKNVTLRSTNNASLSTDDGVITTSDSSSNAIVFDGVMIQAFNNANVSLTGVTFKNGSVPAIQIFNNSTLDADRITVDGNSAGALVAFNNSTATVKNSAISNVGSSAAITVFNDSTLTIKSTTLTNGTDGIVAYNHATVNADKLTIKNFTDGAIITFGNDPFADNAITVQNSEFASNGFAFFPVSKTAISAANNSIHDNNIGVMANPGSTYNFANNWWGDKTGPFNATINPTGTGDEVSDGVTVKPFLTRDPITSYQYSHGRTQCDEGKKQEYRTNVENLIKKFKDRRYR